MNQGFVPSYNDTVLLLCVSSAEWINGTHIQHVVVPAISSYLVQVPENQAGETGAPNCYLTMHPAHLPFCI